MTETMLADAGVPMLAVEAPLMVFVIVPVVLLESVVLSRSLNLGFRRSLKVSTVANLSSAAFGVPLAWGLMLVVGLASGITAYGLDTLPKKILAVTVQSAWLVPYEGELYWMIPAAAVFLSFPTFLISVLIERWIAQTMLEGHTRERVRPAVWLANLASYGLLLTLCLIWLATSLSNHHLNR